MTDKNVFLMDCEQRCAEGVIYSLARNGFSVVAMSPVRLFPSRFSKHIFSWEHSPRLDDGFNEYFQFLCSLKQRGPVIPSGDLSVKFLSTYKEVLQSEGFMVNVPDPNTLFKLFDKWQCNQLCERIGIPVAKSALVNDYADAEKALEAMSWPVIVKPTSLAGGDYVRAHSKKELKNALRSLLSTVSKSNYKLHESGVLVQEWIDLNMTDNWSCDVFFNKDGKLVDSVTIRRIRTSLNKEGLPTSRMYCGEIKENENITEKTRFLLERHGWKGFAHVEYIYCRRINDYILTEVNPRLPGYTYLLSSSGHEQAYYYCADLIGTKYQPASSNDVLYYFETLRYPGDITDGLINSWNGYICFKDLLKSYYIAYKSNGRTVIDYFNIKDLRQTIALQCFNIYWFTNKSLSYLWRHIRHNEDLNKNSLNITNQRSLWPFRSVVRKVQTRIIKKELIFLFVGSDTKENEEDGFRYELFSKDRNNVEISALFESTDLTRARERLGNDEILICLFHNGILVSYGWGREQTSLEFSYVDTVIDLNKSVFYIYDCYTHQEFRGKGYYPRILRKLCEAAGEQEIYVACQSHNLSSVEGILRAGFVLSRTMVLVDLYVYRFRFSFSPIGINL